jgi:predicted alpha/beta hydrolase family esterase
VVTEVSVFMLPGIGSSGPEHWQSQWERRDPTIVRIEQSEWAAPRCADWVTRLESALAQATAPVVLVGHSSACALVAHWAESALPGTLANVHAALLVAPSDPSGPNYPAGPTGFAPMPLRRLPFPTTVVLSSDDPFVDEDTGRAYAAAWAAAAVVIGRAGHINTATGHGPWPEGFELLRGLRRRQHRD